VKKIVAFLIFNSIVLIGFSQNSKTIKVDESRSIECIAIYSDHETESLTQELINKAQIVNEENNGSKYFLDEIPNFLISLNQKFYFGKNISKTLLIYNGDSINFEGIPQIFIKGLHSGDHEFIIKGKDDNDKILNKSKLKFTTIGVTPMFKNDAIVIGCLLLLLSLIFYTSNLKAFAKFYKFVPGLLLCYFLPAILNSLHIISGEYSELYFISSRYLLPASLVLLCLSIDLKEILKLGPKALIMFFAGTVGIVIGGPLSLMIIAYLFPDWLGADAGEVWRGLATVAGSWIGGGANQTAMKEIFETPNSLFSKMIVVDVIVANVWMACLLYGTGINKRINKRLKADDSAIEGLKNKMQKFVSSISRIPTTSDLIIIAGIGITGTGLSHLLSESVTPFFSSIKNSLANYGLTSLASGFFWLIVFATLIGVVLSFTRLKSYEGAGASKMGSLFLYVLVAAIGTHMDLSAIAESPILFAIGGIWMLIHALFLILIAFIIKAPFFFVAVGSQANVGGAASAPVVASAFHPSLAPVGVLLAVMGYAVGTGAAWLCAVLMQNIV
tara:strand:- start:500 stop:2170 length:1671 start_codon:yes stop_codon:yes gene_type:complete